MVMETPALLARLDLLPAEKMLASIDPGYQALEVAARLDTHLVNGHLHFVQYNADSPTGAGYADALADLFYDAPPVKEFRKKYHPHARRQPQASAAGAAQILPAVRRHFQEAQHRHRGISLHLPFRARANTSSSAISSAKKATPWRLSRRSNWSIATASCARALSRSTWSTAVWACRNSCCASI